VRLGRGISRTVARELASVKRAGILKGEAGIGQAKRKTATTSFGQAVERYLQAQAPGRAGSAPPDRLRRGVWRGDPAVGDHHGASERVARREDRGHVRPDGGGVLAGRHQSAPRGAAPPAHAGQYRVGDAGAPPRIKPVKERQGRVRWLTPDEEARLIQACRDKRTVFPLADIVVVALETGMRKGELLGLTWDRVDLSRGVIQLEITKTDRRREIPMRAAVYGIFAAMPEPRRGRVWPRKYLDRVFQEAVAAAGITTFRFHDCRHHFASWFMMRGGDLFALSKILGHSRVSMTERYSHLAPEHLRAQMEGTDRSEASSAGKFPNAIPNTGGVADGAHR
jgi:Phage integrase family